MDVEADREEVLARLAERHRAAVRALGFGASALALAEQVHGATVARVDKGGVTVARADGLVCATPGCVLGIHVADCCAVFLVDPVRRAVGLIHSGRRGSELGIVSRAIASMEREFGTAAGDLIVQLSPCIRPPLYEVDFAAMICRDARERRGSVGPKSTIRIVHRLGPDRFYSYRVERGRTGRMLALLGIDEKSEIRNPKSETNSNKP